MNRNDKSKIVHNRIAGAAREAYDKIVVIIDSMRRGETAGVFAFTSAMVGEGKTLTTFNVAYSAAMAGKKTLLVDCDMRNSKMHTYFNMSSLDGLSDVIKGSIQWHQAIKETKIPNLSLLTSGGSILSSSIGIISSPRLAELLQEWRKEFEYVFIDTAPVLLVSDTISLSRIVDGVFLIIRNGVTNRKNLKRCVTALQLVNANVLGSFINDISYEKAETGYNYGYYLDYKNPLNPLVTDRKRKDHLKRKYVHLARLSDTEKKR